MISQFLIQIQINDLNLIQYLVFFIISKRKMPSLFNLIQKAVPNCNQHQDCQALYYNVYQQQFLCQKCDSVKIIQQSNNEYDSLNQRKKDSMVFELQTIIENPILLMLRRSQFLGSTDQTKTQHYVHEFIRILTEIDSFIKIKKSSHQFTKQYLTFVKDQINKKIDHIIERSQQNLRVIRQIQLRTQDIKKINQEYFNQFLQNLQSNYINGTTEQLFEVFRKYSTQNQNPFRTIDQKVMEITSNMSNFTELNWTQIKSIESKLLDPYLWNQSKIYLFPENPQMLSKREEGLIMPGSRPHLLQFSISDQEYLIPDGQQSEKQLHSIDSQKDNQRRYIRCYDNKIELLSKTSETQFQYDILDQIQLKQRQSIDMIRLLPKKIIVTVSYDSLKFYSYQFDKLNLVSTVNSIKGCAQILVFENFCLVTAQNKLFQIDYFKLPNVQQIFIDQKSKLLDTQEITELCYLYKERQKLENQVLVKISDKVTLKLRQFTLKLF